MKPKKQHQKTVDCYRILSISNYYVIYTNNEIKRIKQLKLRVTIY